MELLLIVLAISFFIYRFLSRTAGFKGAAGERKVIRKLEKLARQNEGARALHNLTLKTPDGSTQIDHLFISTYGIFVIETKNMSGWIFAGENQKRWTQTLYKSKKKFQNPIHQNYKHVKAVQNLLGLDLNVIFNVVVFAGKAEFKTPMPNNVIRLRQLVRFINSQQQEVFSNNEVNRFASIILSADSQGPVSEREHIQNVRNSRRSPLCPKCGSAMVIRQAKKGHNKGSRFWGCTNFPACNGTKNYH